MSEAKFPGTPGGPAQRVRRRAVKESREEFSAGPDTTEEIVKIRQALASNDGQAIIMVIVEEAKHCRAETFAGGRTPEQRLFAIERVGTYRALVEAIYAKADYPIPDVLQKVLN